MRKTQEKYFHAEIKNVMLSLEWKCTAMKALLKTEVLIQKKRVSLGRKLFEFAFEVVMEMEMMF